MSKFAFFVFAFLFGCSNIALVELPGSGGEAGGGSDENEGGAGGMGGSNVVDPEPQGFPNLIFTVVSHSEETVSPGETVHALEVAITADGAGILDSLEVREMAFRLRRDPIDFTDMAPYCAMPCDTVESWNFYDLRVMSDDATLMGPVEFPSLEGPPANPEVRFTDSFSVADGETVNVSLVFTVASPTATPIGGTQFRASLSSAKTDYPNVTHGIVTLDQPQHAVITIE